MNHETAHRLLKHFAAVAALTTLGTATKPVDAAIVYSGVVNIPIPNTIDGVYVNLVTFQTGTSAATVPGWDFNPYLGSGGSFFFCNSVNSVVAPTTSSPASNLPFGSSIGPSSVFNTSINAGSNFSSASYGNVGFRFLNESTGQTNYGYAIIAMPDSTHLGVIREFLYDNTGFPIIISFPAPSSLTLLALGSAGLKRRRR